MTTAHTLGAVPNSPKTPHLTIRAPRELQDAAKVKAAAEGTTVTSIVLAALEAYVSENTAGEAS